MYFVHFLFCVQWWGGLEEVMSKDDRKEIRDLVPKMSKRNWCNYIPLSHIVIGIDDNSPCFVFDHEIHWNACQDANREGLCYRVGTDLLQLQHVDCEVKSATFFVSKTSANPYHLDGHPDGFCEKVFSGLSLLKGAPIKIVAPYIWALLK